jgi:hypothetical protein
MRLHILPLFASAVLLLAGCAGYHVGPVRPTYMNGINTISVPTLRNGTLVPRLEVPLANIVIKQFQQDGTYQIGSDENADAILEGTVDQLTLVPARALRGNVLQTTEFQLQLVIDFKLINRVTGKELVHRKVTGTTEFFVGGDLQQDEQQAIPLAAEQAAVQIVSVLSEGF